jgi:putative membrane protein
MHSLAAQMTIHILAMNVAAPLLILLLRRTAVWPRRGWGGLAPATTLQLMALWAAHAPAVLDAAHSAPGLMLSLHVALFAVALWFWQVVLSVEADRRWRAVLALLITAKLFCLLGVLMVFAPHAFAAAAPADRQAAGLLMLVACPVTYLLAAGFIARSWLLGIEARSSQRAAADG